MLLMPWSPLVIWMGERKSCLMPQIMMVCLKKLLIILVMVGQTGIMLGKIYVGRNHLSVCNGMMFYDARVYIPKQLWDEYLARCHY